MSIVERFAGQAKNLAAVVLAQDCLLCAASSGGEVLCQACRIDLPLLGSECCPVCALPTPGANICGACLKQPPHFDATQAIYRYEFPLDRLIQSLKYSRRLTSAEFFGTVLARIPVPQRPDMILPVPLSAERLAQRGFNQAVEIARPLAHALGMPLCIDQVRRNRDTPPQTLLAWKERKKNIRHAFDCGIDLSGKTVLVIDDVMTTGATLDELARTLKARGAARVENRVLARALKD